MPIDMVTCHRSTEQPRWPKYTVTSSKVSHCLLPCYLLLLHMIHCWNPWKNSWSCFSYSFAEEHRTLLLRILLMYWCLHQGIPRGIQKSSSWESLWYTGTLPGDIEAFTKGFPGTYWILFQGVQRAFNKGFIRVYQSLLQGIQRDILKLY